MAVAKSKARAPFPDAFNTRLAVTCLQVTLRPHVVVYVAQIDFQLFPVQYVLALESGNQAGLFYILHGVAQALVAENCIAFKLNLDDAHGRLHRLRR